MVTLIPTASSFNTSNISGRAVVTNVAGNLTTYIVNTDMERERGERGKEKEERQKEKEERQKEKEERKEREREEEEKRERKRQKEKEREKEKERGMFTCCYNFIGLLVTEVMKLSRRKSACG
ncbi:hypothetical protein FIBSPDRAFT_867795 [Athelia psychrophila]|uniref:Uncharacterized protein n=1 Tax=Athelia psychrophila TaxID=1759441 RepID=A0A166DQY5_9AGAM|nr:hypothetical protein FIBSPDRAFT_867795 [Fibularhizoctonia sp. CBS 109695]